MCDRPVLALPKRILGDRRGVAALELALLAPILVVLLMGLFDVGQLTYTTMQVRAAAHAGALYLSGGGTCTTTNLGNIITAATSLTVTATPPPVCGVSECSTADGGLAAPSGTTCADGDTPGVYATMSAQATYTPLVPWTAVVLPTTVTSNAAIRYQ